MTAQPIDVVALVQAIFTGLAAVLSALAGIYAIIAANRAKRAETVSTANANVIRQVEINTNSMTTQIAALSRREGVVEGMERGVATAAVLARGQKEGREQTAGEAALRVERSAEEPVPVADDRTAVAAERSATATERVAAAAEDKKAT